MWRAGTVLATLAVGLAMVGPAQAAVGFQAGEVSDPQGDGTLALPLSGGLPERLLDVRDVRVEHDAGTGSLFVQFTGTKLLGDRLAGLTLHASLSAPNAEGRCDGVLRAGDVSVQVDESDRYTARTQNDPPPVTELLDQQGIVTATGPYSNVIDNGVADRLTIRSALLLDRDLRCVSAVFATRSVAYYEPQTRDDVDPFCLESCPVAPVEAATTPPATPAGPPSVAPLDTAAGPPSAPVAPAVPPVTADAASRSASAAMPLSEAAVIARRTLAARYGTAFSQRRSGSLSVSCTRASSGARCTVRWRYRRSRYSGTVTLVLRDQRYVGRLAIRRGTTTGA